MAVVKFRHNYTTSLIDAGKLRNISWPRFKQKTYCRQYNRAVIESELARSRPRYVQMKFPFTVPELRGPSFTVNGKHLTPSCLSTLLNDTVSGLSYMASVMNERMDG